MSVATMVKKNNSTEELDQSQNKLWMNKLCDVNVSISIVGSPFPRSKVPYSKIHWATMGPIWGRQDPDGPHVGTMHLATSGLF